MSHDREYSPGPADQAVANDYDSFAEAYAPETESNLINGYYTRPAVLDLAGDVAGRRILDVGCGAGPLLAALRERGALVTGVDSSTKMLELARQRLGDGADLHLADLSNPLPFPDGAFDDVIACLVLHYLEDWTAPLTELRRVLAPGGRLIVAVNHPTVNKLAYPDADYFATRKYSEDYTFSGQNAVLTYWHRPLHAMTAPSPKRVSGSLSSASRPPHQAPASCSPTSLRSFPREPFSASCSSSLRLSSATSG